MTVQIDDAGWGSLVGGVLIGACREESPQTQHGFREIPATFFQGEAFSRKAYLDVGANLALELMEELDVPKDEPVKVCTGYVLQAVRAELLAKGYQVIPAKIGDPLQTLIETELLRRVQAIGVDTNLETLTEKQGLFFWQCVRWLKGGDLNGPALPERERQCKTGWSSFRIWADLPYNVAKVEAKRLKAARRRQRWNNYG